LVKIAIRLELLYSKLKCGDMTDYWISRKSGQKNKINNAQLILGILINTLGWVGSKKGLILGALAFILWIDISTVSRLVLPANFSYKRRSINPESIWTLHNFFGVIVGGFIPFYHLVAIICYFITELEKFDSWIFCFALKLGSSSDSDS
jgi:hypothetical protein